MFKKILKKIILLFGYEFTFIKKENIGTYSFKFIKSSMKNKKTNNIFPVEIDSIEREIINYVIDKKYTMTSVSRLISVLKSCKYIVENDIPGDFVELGVWRGGNGILAKKIFNMLGSNKKVWMYDTFTGMTEPSSFDVDSRSKDPAIDKYNMLQRESHNDWCFASIEEVKLNCIESGLDIDSFRFIKGDVLQTLKDKSNLPKEISLLRLDTDWYESTKLELELLYPLLSNAGILIIDDYGDWEGAKKAVDEYFVTFKPKPYLHVVDNTCRLVIKPN